MKCPNCESLLVMSERQGIEIDYCPNCRGVWLDRGELDKIIEKSMSAEKTKQTRPYNENKGSKKEYDDADEYQKRNYPQKRKGGFLGNLFDFD
ncbi:MAG: zf-TFIIB domain-containing protein [Chitinophagaceae bacterium]|nr:zf-TFIIB domain-containing protein [Chitinophagaceae bacterium]